MVFSLFAAGAASASATTRHDAVAVKPVVCTRLEQRIAQAPSVMQRIQDRIDALEARLASVRNETRRARLTTLLQPRIDRLKRLAQQIDEQVVAAQRLCGNGTV